MPKITVSDRREDTEAITGRIFDERYFALLRQTITNTYVKMIVPGAP